MSNSNNGKNIAIISHLWIIGWVIALVMNNSNKTELGSFYLRQSLGIYLLSFLGFIPVLGWIIGVVCIIFWTMSLIGALSGSEKPVFILGEHFQNWFKFV